MVLFTLLLIALLIATIVVALTIGIGGAVTLVVFGDAILCIMLIILIIRHFAKKK